jgi:hypothetical protein
MHGVERKAGKVSQSVSEYMYNIVKEKGSPCSAGGIDPTLVFTAVAERQLDFHPAV